MKKKEFHFSNVLDHLSAIDIENKIQCSIRRRDGRRQYFVHIPKCFIDKLKIKKGDIVKFEVDTLNTKYTIKLKNKI